MKSFQTHDELSDEHEEISMVSFGGFTYDALRTAFESVENKIHWKNPIVSIIPENKKELISVAIEFFTATEAKFSEIRNPETNCVIPGFLIVTSVGYRNGPAGDH